MPSDVNLLIRELIRTSGAPSPAEIEQVLDHIVAAPFDNQIIRVPARHRDLAYEGRTLARDDDSLFYHLVKRVVVEEQWSIGTTADQYLEDLQRAVRWSTARLVLYYRVSEHYATVISPTAVSVPARRRGPAAQPWLLVVYSADREAIVSGYQFSNLQALNISPAALWLR
jgi:hypothetical protein